MQLSEIRPPIQALALARLSFCGSGERISAQLWTPMLEQYRVFSSNLIEVLQSLRIPNSACIGSFGKKLFKGEMGET